MMAGLSDKPVNTCSISFGDPAFNEAHYAAEVAEQFGTDHQVEEVDPDDFALIDQLAGLYDEPYADSSAMPTYRVCELARKRVTVALSGDGGDENFAGYRRYRWHMYEERLRSLMPRGLRKPLFGALGQPVSQDRLGAACVSCQVDLSGAGARFGGGLFPQLLHPARCACAQQLYSAGFRKQLDGYHGIEVFNRYLEEAPEHPLSLVQYLDMKTYLAGDILTKVDRASMAHALEVRVPILDHEFVEWVSGLPPEMKLRGRRGQAYLQAGAGTAISAGRSCTAARWALPCRWPAGSGVPLRQRIRNALLGPTLAGTGIFNAGFPARPCWTSTSRDAVITVLPCGPC